MLPEQLQSVLACLWRSSEGIKIILIENIPDHSDKERSVTSTGFTWDVVTGHDSLLFILSNHLDVIFEKKKTTPFEIEM